MSRQSLEKTIEVASRKLAELDQYGDDHYPNGTVIRFRIRYTDGPQTKYRFAAIKAAGTWWVTGRAALYRLSWDRLVEYWSGEGRTVSKIQVAQAWFPLGWEPKGSTEGDIRENPSAITESQMDAVIHGAGYLQVTSNGDGSFTLVRIHPDRLQTTIQQETWERAAALLEKQGLITSANILRKEAPK